MNNNNGQHTTCPQLHEQLLMGWIAGGMMTMTRMTMRMRRRRVAE
jgi:hypothetical protein